MFLFENFIARALPRSLSDSGGGIIAPNTSTRYIFWPVAEGITERGFVAVDTSDNQGVMVSHKFISSLLILTGNVAVKARMSPNV